MQRASSAFTRVFDALWLRRTGTHRLQEGAIREMGPGSAAHHFVMHRVRGTVPIPADVGEPHVEIASHRCHQRPLAVDEMVGADYPQLLKAFLIRHNAHMLKLAA